MGLFKSLQYITAHPLNQNQKYEAIFRWLAWQIRSRLRVGPFMVPFVNDSKLLVSRGMTGATGNIYCGLHEFQDMSFLLHLLGPEDLFIDVGANVGSYTVLAGGVIGAKCLSFEPVPNTFAHLIENIQLNGLDDLVTAINMGIGRNEGSLKFTSSLDTMNHVIDETDIPQAEMIEVTITTLDKIANHLEPTLIKIDVEGFETEVVAGAQKVLSRD